MIWAFKFPKDDAALATVETVSAVCSVLAAIVSAGAAWKSNSLAKGTAAKTAESERRQLEREVTETVCAIEVDSRHAASLYSRLMPLLNSYFNLTGALNGSVHKADAAAKRLVFERISQISDATLETVARLEETSTMDADELAARMPQLSANLRDLRTILEDGRAEYERLSDQVAALSNRASPPA